jgi:hypothetical protein
LSRLGTLIADVDFALLKTVPTTPAFVLDKVEIIRALETFTIFFPAPRCAGFLAATVVDCFVSDGARLQLLKRYTYEDYRSQWLADSQQEV